MVNKIYKIYILIKPLMPQFLRIFIRGIVANFQKKLYKDIWPIDIKAMQKPFNWKGWPDGKKFAFVITHDVETMKGYRKVKKLAEIDKEYGFVSCFNFVPKRYHVEEEMVRFLKEMGHEVGVHGLYHDGKLFSSRKIFDEQYPQINEYIRKWGSSGFYAPSTLRNLEWIHDLHIEYDSSTFDTDPFEPQPDGMRTIFPFIVKNTINGKQYTEIPYTLPQDNTLYVIMKQKNINTWKEKTAWLVENNAMVNFRTHPDYMNFDGKFTIKEYSVELYKEYLQMIRDQYRDQYWSVLPKDLSVFWRRHYDNVYCSSCNEKQINKMTRNQESS